MTFFGDLQGDDPDLCLFVNVVVQELRDDLPADKQASKPIALAVELPATDAPVPPPDATPKSKAKKP